MKSLFIDTHDAEIIIALYDNKTLVESSIKESMRNHSDYTMPMIKDILDKNNITVHDLDEIIVVNGPGSFTGVRLGVTIAKTLAYTLNIPIKAITSLEVYALSNSKETKKLVTINDVKGVFGALYTSDNKLIGEVFYKSNKEFQEYVEANHYEDIIINSNKIDFDNLINYMDNIEPTVAHKVNPIYIKVIEALKND